MRERRWCVLGGAIAIALLAMPATTHAQDPRGIAGKLRKGQAQMLLTGDGLAWNSRVNIPLLPDVLARPRGRSQLRDYYHAWVKWHPGPGRRCARSFAADRGRSLGSARDVAFGGALYFRWRKRFVWRRPGPARFCIWLAKSRRSRVKPSTEDVVFYDRVFGAATVPAGSFARVAGQLTVMAVSTVPMRETFEATPDPNLKGCEQGPRVRDSLPPSDVKSWDGFFGTGTLFELGVHECENTETWTYQLLEGPPDQLAQGSLSYSTAEHRLSPMPLKHLGACVLGATYIDRTVEEVRAYLAAVGCRLGRVIPLAREERQHGEVWSYLIHGGRAELAPLGTTVDILVNP